MGDKTRYYPRDPRQAVQKQQSDVDLDIAPRQAEILTIGVLDLDTVGGHGRLAGAGLILSKHAELISPVLNEVGDVEDVRDAGCGVDTSPVVRAMFTLVDPVAGDATATI